MTPASAIETPKADEQRARAEQIKALIRDVKEPEKAAERRCLAGIRATILAGCCGSIATGRRRR